MISRSELVALVIGGVDLVRMFGVRSVISTKSHHHRRPRHHRRRRLAIIIVVISILASLVYFYVREHVNLKLVFGIFFRYKSRGGGDLLLARAPAIGRSLPHPYHVFVYTECFRHLRCARRPQIHRGKLPRSMLR